MYGNPSLIICITEKQSRLSPLLLNYGIISEQEPERVLFLSSRLESLSFIHEKETSLYAEVKGKKSFSCGAGFGLNTISPCPWLVEIMCVQVCMGDMGTQRAETETNHVL